MRNKNKNKTIITSVILSSVIAVQAAAYNSSAPGTVISGEILSYDAKMADINNDDILDSSDLHIVEDIFSGISDVTEYEQLDFDYDEKITVADYCKMKSMFLECQLSDTSYNYVYNFEVSVSGDGFLQVMQPDGHVKYTKKDSLRINEDNCLVDTEGNYVLGISGDSAVPPSSEIIRFSIPAVEPAKAEASKTIDGVTYSVTSEKCAHKGNVFFSLSCTAALPEGQKVFAEVSGGSIRVSLNSNEYFHSMQELSDAVNQAITDAMDGEEHPGGYFTISSSDEAVFGDTGLTGLEIAMYAWETKLNCLVLSGGTEGGEQTINDLLTILIEADGSVFAVDDFYGAYKLGRIDPVVFDNPSELKNTGDSYFEETAESGKAVPVKAGMDENIQVLS